MNYEYEQSTFSKSLMAGLFSGIAVTIVNLVFNYIYRAATSFSLSEIVNVSSIIFGSILLSIIAGLLYYLIVPYLKKNVFIYAILFVVVTVLFILSTLQYNRSHSADLSSEFRGLIWGIVVITAAINILCIPYMAQHKNKLF